MASTPGSMPFFSFASSISRFFAMLTHCFNLDALLVAISTSTGPRESMSKITLNSSSGTAWYKSKGCFSWLASSIQCLGPLKIPNLYRKSLLLSSPNSPLIFSKDSILACAGKWCQGFVRHDLESKGRWIPGSNGLECSKL